MKTIIVLFTIVAIAFGASGTYNYLQNGADWTGTCSTGTEQSPIDLKAASDCEKDQVLELTFTDNNYTNVGKWTPDTKADFKAIQANIEASKLYIKGANDTNGKNFTALQFHLHAPSEHTLDGKLYDVEVHIVHQLDGGSELAVTGLFFDKSLPALTNADDYFFSDAKFSSTNFDQDLANFNPKTALDGIVDETTKFYFYMGSLTTPPCTEGVNWFVVDKALPITQAQLDKITAYFASNNAFAQGKGNNRAVQPLNQRTLKASGTGCSNNKNTFGAQIGFSAVLLAIFAMLI